MTYEFHFWWAFITIAAVMGGILTTCAYLILLERKLSAYVQDRIGPNRVGPFGLLQPLADGLKFILKEEIIPSHVDKLLYVLAPAIAVMTALMAFVVVPFGATSPPPTPPELPAHASAADRDSYEQVRRLFDDRAGRSDRSPPALPPLAENATPAERTAHATRQDLYEEFQKYDAALKEYDATYQFVITPRVDIGILFVFAIGSLAVYAIILGGWSSNNKYSLLGAMRSSAQLISYEIPLGMSVLSLVLLSKSLNLEQIIDRQAHGEWHGNRFYYGTWFVFFQPLAFLLFLTSIFAECNRLPFDLPEAEQELVGGYHTEYSAMKFAMFFLGEYAHMITTSFLAVALFFGGWHLPWVAEAGLTGLGGAVVKLLIMGGKMALFIVFYMLIRWTIPRFRFDQLMGIAWKVLIPLALVNLVTVMIVQHLIEVEGWGPEWKWVLLPVSLLLVAAAGLLSVYSPKGPRQSIRVVRGHEQIEITVG